MNGTMPATVKRRVGSSLTSEADGTTVCPRSPKNSSQRRRISAVCMEPLSVSGSRTGGTPSGRLLDEVGVVAVGGADRGAQLGLAGLVRVCDGLAELPCPAVEAP